MSETVAWRWRLRRIAAEWRYGAKLPPGLDHPNDPDWISEALAVNASVTLTPTGVVSESVAVALRNILPMAKAYARKNRVGNNGMMVAEARAALIAYVDECSWSDLRESGGIYPRKLTDPESKP